MWAVVVGDHTGLFKCPLDGIVPVAARAGVVGCSPLVMPNEGWSVGNPECLEVVPRCGVMVVFVFGTLMAWRQGRLVVVCEVA